MKNIAYRSFENAPTGRHVVTIGTFDGVHIGHQYLLRQAASRADELGLPLLVVTFEPNPAQVIRPDHFRGRLNTPEQKLEHLWATGVGDVLVIPFTEALMHQQPEEFLRDLVGATNPAEVWVGEGFALGYNRAGGIEQLKEIGDRMGFVLVAVQRREFGDEVVSSSRIRNMVLEGDAEGAAELLGYPYRISGEVIHGAQVGRTIGFPTANVEPPVGLVALPDGIYASRASVAGSDTSYDAMTYIGTRPALNTGARQIETNLLDFEGDLYGQVLHTDFVKRLRPDATFDSVEELVAQLRRDEVNARGILGARAQTA